MRIQQWISGKELMERWQVKPLDLVDIVLYENLSIFEPDGRLAEYKFEESLRANHPEIFPLPPLPKKDNPSMYELILNPEPYDFEIPGSTLTDPNYIPLANRIEQLMFKLIEVERFETENYFPLEINQVKLKKERKKPKTQICKEKVREEASDIWNREPTITIEDMAISDKITNITMEQCGKMFNVDTIRMWIKDLCPNRSPGRRPVKEQRKSKKKPKIS